MKPYLLSLFLFFITALLLPLKVSATHIMGADISYTWVSGNTYNIKVAFYRNCGPGANGQNPSPANQNITLNVRSSSCGYSQDYTLQRGAGVDVSPVCATAATACTSGSTQGVERYYYTQNITLPTNCSDWIFSWSGLARNQTISTINQTGQGDSLYVAAKLNSILAPGNTSPVFSSLPVPYFCAGSATSYNHGAYDADGDSLVYSIVAPQNSRTPTNVNFINPYSATYPIATTPTNNFVFNSLTGQMTFTPSTVQLGVTAVRVDEYRNGQLIGSVTRDIQLVVLSCNGNQPTAVGTANNVTGAVSLGNNTFKACVGQQMSFQLTATDPNTGTNISMTTNLTSTIPGATFTTTGTNPKTGTFTWTPTAADVGYKVFTITISDNACPIPSISVVGFAINVFKVDLSAPDFMICPGITSTIQLNASISGGVGCPGGGCYTWTPSTNLSATTIANPVATVSNPINYTVSYNDGVCAVSDVVQILPVGSVTITPQTANICLATGVTLNAPNTFPSTANVGCGTNNAPCSGSINTKQVGTATTTTDLIGGIGTPYQGDYQDGRVQYLFLASELTGAGIVPGVLRSLALNITQKNSTLTYNNFSIRIGCTTLSTLNASMGFASTGLTAVYAGILNTLPGWNTYNFTSPYQWDGTSNIIVQICYDNSLTSLSDHVEYTTTSFNSVLYNRVNAGVGCSLGSPIVASSRPNIQFTNCSIASPVTYSWTSIFGNTAISSLSSLTSTAPLAHPLDTTIYVVSVSNGVCTVRDTATVYTYPQSTLNALPSFTTCPGDTIILTASGNNITSYTWNNGLPAGSTVIVAPLTTTTYTVTAHTANCGNLIKSSTITVIDSIKPSIYNCPSNVVLYNTATSCSVPYSWTPPTFTDNCPRATMTQIVGLPNGSNFPLGTTYITYDAADLNNNHKTCTFLVQVKDTIKPVISNCPLNITVNSNPTNCKATVSWIAPTASDNCPSLSFIQIAGLSNGSSNFPVGITTITYKATDPSGNVSFCTFTITVLDVQPPNILSLPNDIVINNDSNFCSAVVAWLEPTTTDNCTVATISQTGGILNGGVFPLGVSTVTYTAIDSTGNTTIDSFTVTVNDVQVPTFVGCLSDTIVSTDIGQCTAVFSWNTPTAFDNCPGVVTATQIAGPASGSIFPPGNTTIAYSATDIAGNIDTCSFVVTVADLEAPIILNCPGNITIPKDTNLCGGVVTWIEPTTTDNCGSVTLTQVGGLPSGSFFPLGPTNIVYLAMDSIGNTDTCQFIIFVTDASFPIINGCPSNISVNNDTGVCGAMIAWIDPTVTDNCPGATLQVTQGLPNNSIFPIGTTTVTYTATDAALNVVTCTFTVTVTDAEFPVLSNCPTDTIVGNDLNMCSTVVTWTPPTPSDNCPNFVMVSNYAPGDTFPLGTTHVLYVLTDSVGNVDSCSFNITVNDTQGPLITNCPSNIVQSSTAVSCDAVVTWTPPTIADNCSGFTVVNNYNPGNVFPSGVTTVTYTATDTVGNISICSFTVTINDSIPPIISGCPADISINTNGNCQAIVNWIAPTASDNCPNFTFTSNYVPGDTFSLGMTNVIYIATDGVGNADTCIFMVNVIDSIPPIISNCPANINYQLTVRCDTTITWTVPSFTDNCVANLWSNHNPNDVFPIGTTTVTYIATDSAFNADTCNFTIMITPPNPLISTMSLHSNVHCYNGNDGKASVAVIGGSGSYIYSWTSVPSQNTDTAFNLTVGTYYVYISDSLAPNCVAPIIDSITIIQLPILDVVATGTNPTCFGFSDGSILATASAGTLPYTYSWVSGQTTAAVSGLPIGTYMVYVRDSFNCIDSATIILIQPDSLSGLASQINVDCKGNKTGAAAIVMSGGTPPYQYQWSDASSSTTSSITNVPAGNYGVTITDANNCLYTHNYTITEPEELIISTIQTEIICHNSATGTGTVNIQGGTTPYTISWNSSPPQSTTTATNLPFGTYKVIVTDAHGCSKQKTITLINPPLLNVKLVGKVEPYCDWPNGSISVIATGGIPGYVYTWDTNPLQTGTDADTLLEGDYQVIVTDTRGCTDTLVTTLTNTPPATTSFTSTPSNATPILLSQASNIAFTNTSTGAVAYSWNFGDTHESIEVNPHNGFFETTTYTVTLTAYNSYFVCPTTYSQDYEIIFDGAVYTPNVFTPNGDGNNDVFMMVGDGLVSIDWIVFDRWGKEVYHGRALGDSWDGTKEGVPVPEGTYTYILNALQNDGHRMQKGGTVMVIR
jgi:gliding motility-associated-like protein